MSISRREFLGTTAIAGLAAGSLPADSGKTALPTRVLGNTGARVSILAMGTGSRFLSYTEEGKALEAIQKALDLGLTYIDSADDYRRGPLPQQRIGTAIKGRRNGIFLATKLSTRDADE